MTALIQKRLTKGGLSKQTAKGAPAAAATFAFGVTEGSVFKMDVTEAELAQTWGNLAVQGFDRSALKPSIDAGIIATPALTGLLLLGGLGTDVVTGAGPYTHTITSANDYPYLTGWGTLGLADWGMIADCKVSSLELAWEHAGRVTAKIAIPGLTPSFLAAAYTETNQELLATVGFFAAAGGLFQVEGVTAQVVSGSVKIDTHIEQVETSATVTPADVVPGKREITWSLKVKPNDTGLFREVVFGSNAAGALATVATSPRVGSIETKFIGPAGLSLDLLSSKVKFVCEFPAAGPEGQAAEFTVAGISQQPAAGSEITAVCINNTATY